MNDFIKYLPEFWKWLTSIQNWNSEEGCLAQFFVLCAVLYFLGKILKYFLNEIIEIRDKWEKLGLPVTFSVEKKAKIRQRQQFCGVLRSDLASIAKAENWNEHFFTDLEAEVEAEGYYFTSSFNRMIRKKSYGLRREPSLIKSIDKSAEQFLLLIGAPGSGKSVALRHLAHQLAERAIKSSDEKKSIPLYINLKELPSVAEEQLTPDFIKQFILDNIRRGDADTVDYIRENWDEYRSKGIWFFLFDSFDEIPAVLHAPTGSKVVQLHSEAIRQFLAGMSSCRGVLASREFKGPETLSWQKFRILPLSAQRKEALIENSFLKLPQKKIVLRHLAANESTIHSNPLFLTLLCRYVKEENAAPVNDHDLLSRHIQRLAYRDPEYTKKRYALSPEQLLQGATTLAVLFAENASLSLAPTQDEIAAALEGKGKSLANLGNLLAALVDVKIARSDVQEARRGDRRFTFSHRRYQETLFVNYLAEHADFIHSRELLTNLRWREYAVTLLQTQPIEKTETILNEAAKLINKYSKHQKTIQILPKFGGHLKYYEWDENAEIALLHLLQEGLMHRKDIPVELSRQIALLLEPRWNDGDEYDQEMAIETGGLLPQHILVKYLTYAIDHGSEKMRDIAFKKMIFLADIPDILAKWLRTKLSMKVLSAKNRAEILKLEAISSSLPDSINAHFVFFRSLSMRKINFLKIAGFEIIFEKSIQIINIVVRKNASNEEYEKISLATLTYSYLMCITLSGEAIESLTQKNQNIFVIENALINAICLFASVCFPVFFFASNRIGRKLTLIEIFKFDIPINNEILLKIFLYTAGSIILLLFASLPGIVIGIILNFKAKENYIIAGGISTIIVIPLIVVAQNKLKEFFHIKSFKNFAKQNNIFPEFSIARSTDELFSWVRKEIDTFLPDRKHIRSLLRLLKSQPMADPQHPVFKNPLFQKKWKEESVNRIAQLLLEKLRK